MNEMLELAKDCGPNVGLLLDVCHWHHSGGTTQDIVTAGRERIVHVHFNDAPNLPPDQIRDNQRLLPGEGVINLTGFLQALQRDHRAGACRYQPNMCLISHHLAANTSPSPALINGAVPNLGGDASDLFGCRLLRTLLHKQLSVVFFCQSVRPGRLARERRPIVHSAR